VIVLEKEVVINWKEKEEKVILRRAKWGDLREAMKKSIVDRGGVQMVDNLLKEEWEICLTITQAPFPLTPQSLHELDWIDGDAIQKAYLEINNVKKNKN